MTNQIQVKEKTITDNVLKRVNKMQLEGSLQVPENYSPQNALKSAYLTLLEVETKDKKPALQACTPESIANSLLEMVVQGLNPMKNQGYFIPYGNKLKFTRSYLGTIAITKRLPGVKDVKGYAIYKDDEFETDFDLISGSLRVAKYKPDVTKRNPNDLVGAFALIIGEEDVLHMEYMDMKQITSAWNMGRTKGGSGAHKQFPDQMAIRTVINRACKMYANTSDDSDIIANQLNKATIEVQEEIEENANKELLDFEENIVEVDYEIEGVDQETGEILEKPIVDLEF